MGNTAMAAVLNEPMAVTKNHGKTTSIDGRKYFITYHPAAILRFPDVFKKQFLADFKKLKKLL